MLLDVAERYELLNRVVQVCKCSGYRSEGIFKAMEENRNLYNSFLEYPDIADEYSWFLGCTEAHDQFFENILSALRPTFPEIDQEAGLPLTFTPPWPGQDYTQCLLEFKTIKERCHLECFERLMAVCGSGNGLLYHQEQNHLAVKQFIASSELKNRLGWVQIWFSVKELFFEDLRRALKIRTQFKTPWLGISFYESLLSFNPSQHV